MVTFLDASSSTPAPAGWTQREMRLQHVSQPHPSFCLPPQGRVELPQLSDESSVRSFGVLPPQSRNSERVCIYRDRAWTAAAPRSKKWYFETSDVEYVEDLLEELMRGDHESYLARQLEYSEIEDQKTFGRISFRLFAQGPIVERLQALTLVDPKADGGFWISDCGPYYVDFLDRPRSLTLLLSDLPPKINPSYLGECMKAAGYVVTDAKTPPSFRGIARDDHVLVTVVVPPDTPPPCEVAFTYHGRRLLSPVRVVRNRSVVYDQDMIEEEDGYVVEDGEAGAVAHADGDEPLTLVQHPARVSPVPPVDATDTTSSRADA